MVRPEYAVDGGTFSTMELDVTKCHKSTKLYIREIFHSHRNKDTLILYIVGNTWPTCLWFLNFTNISKIYYAISQIVYLGTLIKIV